jgi:hypothetical protein
LPDAVSAALDATPGLEARAGFDALADQDAGVGVDAGVSADATVPGDASSGADASAADGGDASSGADAGVAEGGNASGGDAGACLVSCDSELVLRSDGTLWHYTGATSTPTEIFGTDAGSPVVTSYADGYNASCAVRADHTVYCWSYGSSPSTNGDLGNGTNAGSNVPTLVITSEGGPALSGIAQVFVDTFGGYASCGLDSRGAVWCWGQNTFETLADGGKTRSYVAQPELVSSGGAQFSGVAKVAVSASHVCAIKIDGTLWCWGATHRFVSPNYDYPTHMTALPTTAVDVGVDPDATCAVTSDGRVWCWGYIAVDGVATPDGGPDVADDAPVQLTAGGAVVTDALQVEMTNTGALCILRSSNRGIWCNGQITGTTDLAPWAGAMNDTIGVFFLGKGVAGPCYIDSQRRLSISGFSVPVPVACP